MATVAKGTVTSLGRDSTEGTVYTIFLDNGAPDGAGTDLNIRSASLAYKSESEEVDAHLLLSKATVTFSAANSTHAAIFGAMVQANELQYRLRIEKDGSLWWVGFVLVDLVKESFSGYPKDFTVVATDGISRTKSIDYEQNALNEFATVREHLFNVLSYVPLNDYFSASAEYLRIHSTLVPEGMTAGVNTFEKLRLNFKALRTVDKTGTVKYQSVYNALLEILKAFNLRLTFSNGRYTVSEIGDYARQLEDVVFYRYDKDATELTATTLTSWADHIEQVGATLSVSDGVARAGGTITRLAPLRSVNYVYKHYTRQNLLPDYANRTLVTSTTYQEVLNFGTDGGAGTISISGNVSGSFTAGASVLPANASVFVRLAASLVIVDADDDNNGTSLKREVVITSNGFSYRPVEWVDSNVGQLAYFMLPLPPRNATNSGTAGFTISTPIVPRSGKLRFAITHEGVFVGGTEYDPSTVTVRLQEFYIESVLTGSIDDQYNYTTYPSTGAGSGANSIVLDRENLFGDGPGDNTFGRIEYTENGTDWQRTDTWKRYADGGYLQTNAMEHGDLISKMTLALQEAEREQLDITVIAPDYEADFMIGSGSALYLMKAGTINLSNDEWRGRWFEIATNFYDTATDGVPTVANPGPSIGPGDDVGEPDVNPVVSGNISPSGGFNGTVPGINTVSAETDEDITEAGTINGLSIPNLDDVPLFAGDNIIITNTLTEETQVLVVQYDSNLGVPDPDQITPGGTSVPYYGPDGLIWLIPDTGEVSIVAATATADFPAGSYIQPEPQFTAQLQAALRKENYDFHLFDYDTSITTGFVGPFWRAGNRIGWGIRKVHFAFAQDMGATAVKVNLKYYDATGFRYTVATFNSDGLGGIVDAYADVAAGYYRVEVETITGTAPKGLTVSIQMNKTI